MRCVGVYNAYGGDVNTGIWWGRLREGDHLEDPGIDGRKMLKLFLENRDGGINWTDLARIGTGGAVL